jgi:Zn-finger nucleic acid-binding protein
MSLTTCSRCGKEFNSGMRDCPFCGHPRPVEVTREQSTCPRCTLPLESKPFRGQPVDVCPRCEGVWLDSGEFEILTSERDVFADDTLPRHFVRTPPQGETAYLECVRCGRIMNRQNYRTISGVVIDVCPDHGVWLDRDELTELRTFVATGGLEKAIQREALRDRMEIQSLAARVDNLEFLQKVLHYRNIKYWIFRK